MDCFELCDGSFLNNVFCSSWSTLLDVVSIAKTGENFRLLYDSKGRFTLHSISLEEAKV